MITQRIEKEIQSKERVHNVILANFCCNARY